MRGLFTDFFLVFGTIFSYLAYQNAVEAHRHTHELACHVGAEELCLFHKVEP
jgi:hypothetical protein